MTDNLISKVTCDSCGKELELEDIHIIPILGFEVCEDCLND